MPTDEELMLAYSAGNQEAFRTLFDRYAPLLHRVMRRGLRRDSEAADLVQQTFMQLHRARNDFRQDAKLRPWLMTIALNLKRELLRRKKRRPETLVAEHFHEASEQPKDPVEQQQTSKLVREALQRLPDNQREVIELHWFGELSFPEIAEIVGASLSAVKVRAHRGYKQLKQILHHHHVNEG